MKAWQARRLAASPLCSARNCAPTTEAGSSAPQAMGRPRIAVERGVWTSCTRATKPAVAASHVQAMSAAVCTMLPTAGTHESKTGFAEVSSRKVLSAATVRSHATVISNFNTPAARYRRVSH